MAKILWLVSGKGISDGQKFALGFLLQKEKLSVNDVTFYSLNRDCKAPPTIGTKTKTGKDSKRTVPNPVYLEEARVALKKVVAVVKPKVIVTNDNASLRLFCKDGNLEQQRGSVYEFEERPVLIVDDFTKQHTTKHGRWALINDMGKLGRYMADKQRLQPKFVYKVCRTVHDLIEAVAFAKRCFMISRDIETWKAFLNCDGFCGITPEGEVRAYVIPIYNPFRANNRHWNEEDEAFAFECIRKINDCEAAKILQNGGYDAAYYIRHGAPLRNWFADTMHLFHSVWPEAPKKLNFIASICLDYVRFWKEEGKGDAEERKKGIQRFKNEEALERYWRYNACDCYYTLLAGRVLISIVTKIGWARDNYSMEFSMQVGPALAMSMRGLKADGHRLHQKEGKLEYEYSKNLSELRTMCDDPDFNPNSPAQFSHLLYQTLGAKMPVLRGKAASKLKENSTDEKVLKLVCEQHPIFEMYIKKVWATKKPRNNISKYCRLSLWLGRYLYSLNAGGTKFGRFSGSGHQFWVGTNPQNVPNKIRDFVIADDGYVFFEPDFSQSDARFIAYETEDPVYIANVESGKDTHCLHAAHFFKPRTYEEIKEGVAKGDEFYSDEVTGIRAVTKKIVHGKNYDMAGFTLYMLMGRRATIAAAKALGHANPGRWNDKELAAFCQTLLNSYDKLYTKLAPWKKAVVKAAIKAGNKIKIAFGKTILFFGDLEKDKNSQRELASAYGQGATAGNINRCLKEIYYGGIDDGHNCILMTQTHDSMLFMIREELLHHYASIILTIMGKPVIINGRSLSVPSDAKCGYRWGRGLVKYKPTLTLADLKAQDALLEKEHADQLSEIIGEDDEDEFDLDQELENEGV